MAERSYTEQSRRIAQTDWSDKVSAGGCAMALWDSRSYKSELEERAYRNEKYLWGKQWYWWDDTKQDLVPRTDVAGWRTRLVFNETLTTVENRIAKMMSGSKSWSPVLENDDEIAKIRQRLQQQVMSYQWQDGIKMPRKIREAMQWAMSSSCVFLRPFWNKRKGPRITAKLDDFRMRAIQSIPTNDPVIRQDAIRAADNTFWQTFGQDAYQRGEKIFIAGDTDVAIHPIFEVCWWPFQVTDWEKIRLWMWTTKKTVEEVAEEYGLEQDAVREFSVPGYSGASGSFGHSSTKWGDKYFWRDGSDFALEDDSVLCHHIYKPPTEQFPKGRMAVVIGMGGHCIHLEDLNTPNAVIPIIPLVEKPIRGRAPGTCVVDQTIHAQDEINMAASQIADYRNKRLMPTLVDFIGNETHNKKALSNAPGKIYRTASPDKIPTFIQSPDIGADYFRSVDSGRIFMERIGGISSIDTGTGDDSGAKSGRAILALKEQNDLRLLPFGAALDECVEEVGNQVLELMVANTNDQRMVQLVGEGNQLEVVTYRGSDLKSEQQYGTSRPIRCRAFSVIPQSTTELLNVINVLGNQGLLEMQDRNAVLEALGINDFRMVFDKGRADTVRQQTECDKWDQMQPVGPPDESDDDVTHMRVMDKWRKGESYHRLKEIAAVDPMAAQILMDQQNHRNLHEANIARKMTEQKYLLLDADISMWMKHRAQWVMQMAQMDPATMQLILTLYAAPLVAMGAPGDEQQQGQQDESGGGGKADDGTNKPSRPKSEAKEKAKTNQKGNKRMPNGTSPGQGVRKGEK